MSASPAFTLTKPSGTALLQACKAISTALSTSAGVMEGVYLDILRAQREHAPLSGRSEAARQPSAEALAALGRLDAALPWRGFPPERDARVASLFAALPQRAGRQGNRRPLKRFGSHGSSVIPSFKEDNLVLFPSSKSPFPLKWF